MSRGATTPSKKRDRQLVPWAYGVLVLTILFVVAVRWRILDTPLERDEGEFAYGGQLIRQGEIPYKHLYNIKFPGTYAAYAVTMTVFGETPRGIHLGLLLVNVASIALVFQLGKKLHSPAAGAMAAVIFAVITISPDVFGFAAHATHFVTLFALAGLCLLLRTIEHERTADAIGSGVCMGLALLCKQPGITFGLLGFVLLVSREQLQRKRALALTYTAAWIAPFLIVCAVMWATGSFGLFWRWTVTYASAHSKPLSEVPANLSNTWHNVLPSAHAMTWAAMGAFVFIALQKQLPFWKRIFLLGYVLAGVAAVVPGFYFYQHYFVMLAPAVALCISVALFEGARLLRTKPSLRPWSWLAVSAGPIWACYAIFALRVYLFEVPPDVIIGRGYLGNPFVQARVIGKELAEHCPANAKIAVFHSEPEILFYAKRQSATGYIYAYDMTSCSRYRTEMEKEFKDELVSSKPDYVVFLNSPYSWTIEDKDGSELVNWCYRFAHTNCQLVGVADGVTHSLGDTTFKWGREAYGYKRRGDNFIEVYERKAP